MYKKNQKLNLFAIDDIESIGYNGQEYWIREIIYMNKATTDVRLGTEPIGKLMLTMGLPGLAAQLVNLLYNMVDRIYLGHIKDVGQLALTGVGLTLPILQVISAFAALIGNGGAPLAAIALGKGDRKRAEGILGNGTAALLFLSAVLTVVFFLIRKPFLYMIGASDATYVYANQYIIIYLCGTVFVQLSLGLNPYITAQGASKTAMLAVLIGAAVNICLDPLFIFVMKMGVRGAAFATVISQACSAMWSIVYLTRRNTSLRIIASHMKPRVDILLSVCALGVSPFIMQSTESLISMVLSGGLARYGGDLYVGSLMILQSVIQLITISMNGFAHSCAPIMSYNLGAGKIDRVKAVFKRLLIMCFSVNCLITLSTILFPEMYGRMFTDNVELIALVKKVLPIFTAGMLIFGVQCACQNTFMALGQARRSLIIALLRKVVLLVPLALILPAISQSVMSIYWAEPISDTISAAICLTWFILFAKKTNFGSIASS